MKVRGAAARLEVSPATVYSLVASGRLGHYRVGLGRGAIRISEEHIAAYLLAAERGVAPLQAPSLARRINLKHLRLP